MTYPKWDFDPVSLTYNLSGTEPTIQIDESNWSGRPGLIPPFNLSKNNLKAWKPHSEAIFTYIVP